jgi:hypothetical protein
MTRRVVRTAWGAVVMVRQEDATVKDAFAVARLLGSRHTEGLSIWKACEIVYKARAHKLEPFDLFMISESYLCDDLDHAVIKALEIRELYARPLSRIDA